jgi:hypothetical protein
MTTTRLRSLLGPDTMPTVHTTATHHAHTHANANTGKAAVLHDEWEEDHAAAHRGDAVWTGRAAHDVGHRGSARSAIDRGGRADVDDETFESSAGHAPPAHAAAPHAEQRREKRHDPSDGLSQQRSKPPRPSTTAATAAAHSQRSHPYQKASPSVLDGDALEDTVDDREEVYVRGPGAHYERLSRRQLSTLTHNWVCAENEWRECVCICVYL